MDLTGKVVVVTGAGRGIGAAMARRFAAERPHGLVLADVDGEAVEAVAADVDGTGVQCDVTSAADLANLIGTARSTYGPVDVFCANAGIAFEGGVELDDESWDRMMQVNFYSHVRAARILVPEWLSRRTGYLVVTASAAGLLTSLGSAPYAVTKHAAVAFAEWLSITHHDDGIRVSVLCPQGVETDMLASTGSLAALLRRHAISPERVADDVVDGIAAERFLILPHPEVATFMQQRAGDHERWMAGMRRLQAQMSAGG